MAVCEHCTLPWQRLLRETQNLGTPLADGYFAVTGMRPAMREASFALSTMVGSTDTDAKEQDAEDDEMSEGEWRRNGHLWPLPFP